MPGGRIREPGFDLDPRARGGRNSDFDAADGGMSGESPAGERPFATNTVSWGNREGGSSGKIGCGEIFVGKFAGERKTESCRVHIAAGVEFSGISV